VADLAEALERLERAMRSAGHDFKPGPPARPADFDAASEATGLPFDGEVRAWFEWHNGPAEGVSLNRHRLVGNGWCLMSLREAVENYRMWRTAAEDVVVHLDDVAAAELYPPDLFPFVSGSSSSCGSYLKGAHRDGVDLIEFALGYPHPEPSLPSLSTFVELMTRC
jgi:hypothetical protein